MPQAAVAMSSQRLRALEHKFDALHSKVELACLPQAVNLL